MKKILWWRIALAAFALEMLYGMFLVFLLGASCGGWVSSTMLARTAES